jgi:hypothetical protein
MKDREAEGFEEMQRIDGEAQGEDMSVEQGGAEDGDNAALLAEAEFGALGGGSVADATDGEDRGHRSR